MSSQLDDQIRGLMQHVFDAAPSPPDAPSEPFAAVRASRRVPGWVVAVGVAVFVFALIGSVGLLVGTENEQVVGEPTTGADPPSLVASTVPPPSGQTVGVTVSGVSGHGGG